MRRPKDADANRTEEASSRTSFVLTQQQEAQTLKKPLRWGIKNRLEGVVGGKKRGRERGEGNMRERDEAREERRDKKEWSRMAGG